MPDVLSIPIKGVTLQECLDAYLASEKIERECSNCKARQSTLNLQVLVPPATLIIHILRFRYSELLDKSTKLHVPVSCPTNLTLECGALYQLNSIINHIGESPTSGHYNILVFDQVCNSFILLDDNCRLEDISCTSYVAVYKKM